MSVSARKVQRRRRAGQCFMMKEIARTERLWNRLMTGWKQRRPAIERHLKKAGFPSLLH